MTDISTTNPLDVIAQEELAKALKVRGSTLRKWRADGKGPAYFRLEKSVFYRVQDVREWIASKLTLPGGPSLPAGGALA